MNNKGKVLLNSGLYTFSSLLTKAVSFFLLPVYTLFLTTSDYGITNLAYSFNSVATYIVSFSIFTSVIRFYTDYKNDREKLKQLYGTTILFVFISGCSFALLCFLLQDLLIKWFFTGIEFFPVVIIALLDLVFMSLNRLYQSILQGMQNGKKLTIINLIVFGLTVSINLIFIGVFKLGATGVLLATLTVDLLYAAFIIIDMRINDLVIFRINNAMLKDVLKYSMPLMSHYISTHIASFASRVFINSSGDLAAVGLYSVASQFGTVIDTIQMSVNRAFATWFYDGLSRGDEKSKAEAVQISKILLVIYSFFYMGIGLFSQEVLILMTNESYVMAWTVIPILVAAFSIKSMYYFYVNVLFYYKEAAKKVFIATLTGSFADIICANLLIPKYGMYGAALAFFIAKVIIVTIVIILSKKYEDIGYSVIDMLKIVITSLLFMITGLYFSYTKYMVVFSWTNLLYKFAVLAAYLAFVYFTNKNVINNIIKSGKIKQIFRRKKNDKQVEENN